MANRETLMNYNEVYLIRSVDYGRTTPHVTDNSIAVDHQIEIAIGMKIMLTQNLCTSVGLTNGALGIVIDIIPYEETKPPQLPKAIIITIEGYKGPQFHKDFPQSLALPPKTIIFDWDKRKVVR